MSLTRISKLLLSLTLIAALMVLAACSEKSDDTSGDSTTADLSDCTPDQLQTFADGTAQWATWGQLY